MCTSSNHTILASTFSFSVRMVWNKKIAPDKIRGDDNIRAKRYLIGGQNDT